MHLVESVCLFVCYESLPVQCVGLCVSNQGTYTDNSADAVDQLLISTLFVVQCSPEGFTSSEYAFKSVSLH